MKKFSLLLAFLSGIAFTSITSGQTGNETVTKQNSDNQPMAIRKIKLKPGVSAEAFEKFAVKTANREYANLPGVKIYFGKGERGDEPNSYAYFFEFDSKATRDFYAPAEDDNSKTSAEAKKFLDIFFNKYNPEFDKMAEVITPAGKKGYVDYIILQ